MLELDQLFDWLEIDSEAILQDIKNNECADHITSSIRDLEFELKEHEVCIDKLLKHDATLISTLKDILA